jgi:DHA1 family bicyclomycin/chloramphenicol resistance-like MFS transporter
MEHSRGVIGSASGLIGGMQFLFGGVVSPLGALAGEGTAAPFAVIMLGCGLLALAAFAVARATVRRNPELEAVYAQR